MKMKRIISLILAVAMIFALGACGSSSEKTTSAGDTSAETSEAPAAPARENIIKLAETWCYSSLDGHDGNCSWYTSIYGMTENLVKVGDDRSVEPWLAESITVSEDGMTWTVVLKEGICFSNGTAVTPDCVIANLKRAAEMNAYDAILNATYEVVDDKSFTVTTPDTYPTFPNDVSSPCFSIMDLDESEDLDNAPICTGPFKIKSFEPEGTVEVERNENYWDGDVVLDGAIFYYMSDDESKLMAMQNGEIDGYNAVTAASKEVYLAEPDRYTLSEVPGARLQFAVLNENTLNDNLRAAINQIIDDEAMASYLGGTTSATDGPYGNGVTYGDVTAPKVDVDAAKALIEAEGYTLNGNGVYEKDGAALDLNICYYAGRSLDTLAVLMQEQLASAGIGSHLTLVEDADATYVATGDFDIALYCSISDKNGDPFYFIKGLLRSDSRWNVAGFDMPECEELIKKLEYESDPAVRAELSNQIWQMAIDDNFVNCLGIFNSIVVTGPGVSGIGETSPFDFYRIDAQTKVQ